MSFPWFIIPWLAILWNRDNPVGKARLQGFEGFRLVSRNWRN